MTNLIDNGGPAFPSGNEVTLGNWRSSGHSGMNLRDYFAAKAMQAWISRGDDNGENDIAKWSYDMADAMLKARDKK